MPRDQITDETARLDLLDERGEEGGAGLVAARRADRLLDGREVAVEHPGTFQIRGLRRECGPQPRDRIEAIADEDLHRALDPLRTDKLGVAEAAR